MARRYALDGADSKAETVVAADAQQYSQSLLDQAKGAEQRAEADAACVYILYGFNACVGICDCVQ